MFEIDSCARGFHVFQELWTPQIGETLQCVEDNNREDPFAVAVKKGNTTVGHVPRKISCVCTLLLKHGGTIECVITDNRRRSIDLPQGDLEVPCTLKFQGSPQFLDKVRKRLQEILSNRKGDKESIKNKIMDTPAYDTASSTTDLEIHVACVNDCHREAPGRKESSESVVCGVEATIELQILATASSHSTLWLQCKDITLVVNDKSTIESGERLQDQHLNFGQRLLKESFPDINGLRLTLLQDKSHTHPVSNAVQILFVRGNHWITAHTKKRER
jgi:hypothetical protein